MDAYLQAGLDALGDPTRMAIFQRLAAGPLAVNELAEKLPVTRPAVSQHLKVLKDAGLVNDRRDGTRRLYQLNPEGVERLRAHFERMWTSALAGLQAAAEKAPQATSSKTSSPKASLGDKHGNRRRRSRRT